MTIFIHVIKYMYSISSFSSQHHLLLSSKPTRALETSFTQTDKEEETQPRVSIPERELCD